MPDNDMPDEDMPDTERPAANQRALPPAATRALAEAEERRRLADEARTAASEARGGAPREIDGRGGAEPVRFGDWEVKGLATDF